MSGGGLILANLMLAASAVAQPQPASPPVASRPIYVTNAPIILLMDMNSGAVLFSHGAKQRFAPASMTKVMTAYVVLDLIAKGRLKRDAIFTVKPETWKKWNGSTGGSTMFLRPNEKVSVDTLLKGLLTVSGNDAAAVLASGIDGSEAAFVVRMNQVAKRIGMTQSQFGTPNGWPDGGKTQVSANDLVRLADRLIRDFPSDYRRYFAIPSLTHGKTRDGKPITQPNRDPLLGRFEGADGLKTGHTAEAGYCFLGSAVRGGRRLIMVVAGLKSESARREEAMRLMEWGFSQWQATPLSAAGVTVGTVQVQNGKQSQMAVETSAPLAVTLPRGHSGHFRAQIRYAGPVTAPIEARTPVAALVITPDGLPPQSTPLVSAQNVAQGGWWDRVRDGAYRVTGR